MADRCTWCGTDPLYVEYHDSEWGMPEYDPRALWEKLVLDGFQAGLSWITILRKRDAFRTEFDDFDPARVALWDDDRVARALENPGIIRHRGKIEATVQGARHYLRIEADRGFAPWLWSFVGGQPVQTDRPDMASVPTETDASRAMAKALKAEGFTFCGPVIVYAFMQATGMVNDHIVTCHRHGPVRALSAG
ncbi:DNA-3-methyladenine glycosylase I [Paracoccus nototheniae]|uniref:DNA-3-methyladenine glycosylase I n=1 Tax=Paracoccus nototheniae TaxID=2489002 RepID=A0ABW4DUS6_9RHOB|nr:DNA-3-methyladenine glycosylase I [Paracoccus nototheniae]